MLNSLLLADEISEKTLNLVTLISIIAIAVLIIALVCICIFSKKYNSKSIVYGAICIAASFALSFIKFTPVTFGGSITLASFVPILIYAYSQGFIKGLVVGVIFGVLNFIQSPYILLPITFVLDYLLAFMSISLMGLARKFSKSTMKNIVLGVLLVYAVRFIMHFFSGVVYFNNDAVWVDLPATNAFIYSFLYQLVYLIPDTIICLVAFIVLVKSNNFNLILNMIDKSNETIKQTNYSVTNIDAKNSSNNKKE